MANVNIKFNNKDYLLSCDDGQEENLKELANHLNWKKSIKSFTHHESHAASAFYPSPYEDAAILTLDGVGEWTCTSIAYGQKNKIKIPDHLQVELK